MAASNATQSNATQSNATQNNVTQRNATQRNVTQSAGAYQTDAEVQASKRTSIGLSAHRPTAPDTVQRPPYAGVRLSAWWLVFCLVILIVAVGLLVTARALDPTTTWDELAVIVGRVADQPPAASYPASVVHFHDTFKTEQGALRSFAVPGQAAATVLPDEGVYRLDTWPGYLAWSRFTIDDAARLVIDAHATIEAGTPDAAVGLIGRFADNANFYLFLIDGQGRFSVVRYQAGIPTEIRAPTALAALNPAGASNQLTLEDDGTTLHFLGNGARLVDIPVAAMAAHPVGVGTLATGGQSVVVTFDEIGVYEP
jgi:hypothetical protein